MPEQIYGALAKAQADMKNAELDKVNYYKQRYASLAKIRDAVVPHLSKNGICLAQEVRPGETGLMLVTRLIHEDGSEVSSQMPLPGVKSPHEMGSALTYARRYSLSSLCGVVGDEDDDGQAAQDSGASIPQGAQKKDNGRYELKGEGPAKSMSELRKELRGLANETREIKRDEAYLAGFLKDNNALIQQGRVNLPDWWEGNDDWEGMAEIIDAAYARVREADQEFTMQEKVMAG